jgi:hypothetical protein
MERRQFTDSEVKARAVQRAARVLFELWEENRGTHSRLLEMLVPDSYITIGTSKNGGGWREHLVPLSVIRNKCHEIFEADGSIEQAAAFIDAHMKLAHITREERDRLDFEFGLKGKMPENWTPGDYLARLSAAGISLNDRAQF